MECQDDKCRATVGDPMLPERFRVERRRRNTRDTFTLELSPVDGIALEPAAPGQFNMLYVFGVGEVPISVSSAPGGALEHTIRAVGLTTQAMVRLKPGAMLGVRGPYGRGWPLEACRGQDVVIVAGGLGLAPLRGALMELISRPKPEGKVMLIYGARTPADVLYRPELERLQKRGIDIEITVDRALETWRGHVGVVTTLISRASFRAGASVVLMCGPEIMMRFATRELKKRGVPDEAIYLSLDRNMKCAIGFCGHCQFGPKFLCRDGPVFRYDRVRDWLEIREL